jgi:hypothetical protein
MTPPKFRARAFFALGFITLFPGINLAQPSPDPAFSDQPIALNQVGFVTDHPKRFTAPKARDGTSFLVRYSNEKTPLFTGTIQGGIGDFSDFRPKDSSRHYVIELPEAPQTSSDPFLIRANLYTEQFWQSAARTRAPSADALGGTARITMRSSRR